MASAQESRGRVERAFARAQTFSGWGDFGINVRTLGPDLPWNYDSLARAAVRNARSTLDLSTGGGERFLGIIQGQPGRYTATEAWPVNVPVAATRLGPEGVAVVRCASSGGEPLPFRDAAFDLILNRHGGINAAEISRVLQRGGRFLSQQIDPADWPELKRFFPRITDSSHNGGARLRTTFEQLGLRTTFERHDYEVAYGTLEDLVFNLAVTPWTIPGFSLGTDLDALVSLERALTTGEGLVLTRALFLLSAVKPNELLRPAATG